MFMFPRKCTWKFKHHRETIQYPTDNAQSSKLNKYWDNCLNTTRLLENRSLLFSETLQLEAGRIRFDYSKQEFSYCNPGFSLISPLKISRNQENYRAHQIQETEVEINYTAIIQYLWQSLLTSNLNCFL